MASRATLSQSRTLALISIHTRCSSSCFTHRVYGIDTEREFTSFLLRRQCRVLCVSCSIGRERECLYNTTTVHVRLSYPQKEHTLTRMAPTLWEKTQARLCSPLSACLRNRAYGFGCRACRRGFISGIKKLPPSAFREKRLVR